MRINANIFGMALELRDSFILFIFALLTFFGIVGNALTLFVLRKLRVKLGKALDPTTWRIMFNMAFCDVIFCTIAFVMIPWNRIAEDGWPFRLPFVCYYMIVMFDLNNVSNLHMFMIALLRVLAVFLPKFSKQFISDSGHWIKIAIYTTPWFLGFVESIGTYLAGYYRIRYVEELHSCSQVPLNDRQSYSVLNQLRTVTGIIYIAIPFVLGALFYATILTKLSTRRRQRQQRQLQLENPNSVDSLQERQYKAVQVVAWSLAVQMLFMTPGFVAFFFFGLENPLLRNVPMHLVFSVYCAAYLMTPVVYAASSPDMRSLYAQYIRRTCSYYPKVVIVKRVTPSTTTSNQHQHRMSLLPSTTVTGTTGAIVTTKNITVQSAR